MIRIPADCAVGEILDASRRRSMSWTGLGIPFAHVPAGRTRAG